MAATCCEGVVRFFLPEDRPSPIFSTFTILLNFAQAVVVLVILGEHGGSCDDDTKQWSMIGACNGVVNICFAVYLYVRFASKARTKGVAPGQAAWSLFARDWGVCTYMLFLVWLVVWMVMAGSHRSDAPAGDSCADALQVSVIIFALYIALGFFVALLSVCTECCREPSWKRRRHPDGHRPTSSGTASVPQAFVAGPADTATPPSTNPNYEL